MIGQAQIQQPQTAGASAFGGMEEMNSVIGFQHPATPVSTSHGKVMEDLRKQVEFYFGPSNYPNDTYLQQLAATYAGSVPTVVILGFPKVREIFASAAPLPHTMNPQQAEIQLLATALETSEVVSISPDGLWILAPASPHHHHQQLLHPHLHHHQHQQPYGMSSVPLPQQHQTHQHQHSNGKGNLHSPYSVMALHNNGGMMFASGATVPYGMGPQYPPYSLQMDHPQHLLPRYHVSMNGSGSNHNNNNANNSHSHNHNHSYSNHNNHNNNHHHHHNNNSNNNKQQQGETKHHHQYQHQRRYSQGSTKSEGGGHNNNHGHNNKNKAGKRNKKNTRASWTAGVNSVASTGSGGSGGGGGSEKRNDYHHQGPLERRPSSNASFDSNTSNIHNNKDNKEKASGNGNSNTASTNNSHNHNHNNSNINNNKINNNNNSNSNKNKKRQSFKNKDKKKQPGGQQGGGGGRPSSSSSNKSSEILSDEHFPSLPNQKGQKKKSLSMSHMEKPVGGIGALEDAQNCKSAQPYAQALLKSTTTGGAVASSEDSTVTTVNTINTEMEKLAMDSNEDKEDICW